MRISRGLPALSLALVFLSLATAPAAVASMVGKRLLGTVTDAGGKPLEGVKVKLFNVGGAAPTFAADRSAVNAAGSGQTVPQGTGATESVTGPSDRNRMAELTTDAKGCFTFAPAAYVDALLIELDQPGFEPEMVRLPFPTGTTKKTLTLRKPGEAASVGEDVPKGNAKEKAATYFDRGTAYSKAGQWKEAQAAFAEATKLAPDLDPAWLNLAIADMQLGDPAAALPAAEKVLALKPNHPVATMLASDARAALGSAKPGDGKPAAGDSAAKTP